MIYFKEITEENFDAVIRMKRPEDEHYVAPNVYSLAQAWLYRKANDVYPFAIYNDDEPVGFMMLDEDLEERSLIIWRIMFPEEHQNKGYGTEAIRQIIQMAAKSGKYDFMILDYTPGNETAKHVYEKLGFKPTGEISNNEIVMRLNLKGEPAMNIYEQCPTLENENFLIRLIEDADATDLWKVYGDKLALPFFNSDNCNGSNFYCEKREDVVNTIKYWLIEYHENRGFVRFSIVDKKAGCVIGTIEMFRRESEDYYNDCGILRIDVRSDCEKAEILYGILALITEPFLEWFGCSMIATKAAIYAIERMEALKKAGYVKSDEPLIGHNPPMAYGDYWMRQRSS